MSPYLFSINKTRFFVAAVPLTATVWTLIALLCNARRLFYSASATA